MGQVITGMSLRSGYASHIMAANYNILKGFVCPKIHGLLQFVTDLHPTITYIHLRAGMHQKKNGRWFQSLKMTISLTVRPIVDVSKVW